MSHLIFASFYEFETLIQFESLQLHEIGDGDRKRAPFLVLGLAP